MLAYQVHIQITHLGTGRPVITDSYGADYDHTHRLLFAVDPDAAYLFRADHKGNPQPKPTNERKPAHP